MVRIRLAVASFERFSGLWHVLQVNGASGETVAARACVDLARGSRNWSSAAAGGWHELQAVSLVDPGKRISALGDDAACDVWHKHAELSPSMMWGDSPT